LPCRGVRKWPFSIDEPLKILELGSGEGLLAEALLTRFSSASLTALDGSESMRAETTARLAALGALARVAAFDLRPLTGGTGCFRGPRRLVAGVTSPE
jgi:cyclopropane fatty-acyl-phospholipid synthase-like methyltransferase